MWVLQINKLIEHQYTWGFVISTISSSTIPLYRLSYISSSPLYLLLFMSPCPLYYSCWVMTYSPPTTPAPNPPPPDLLQYGWISLKSSSHLQVKLCLKEACRNMGHEGTKSLISPGSCYFVSLALGDAIRLCENLVGGRRPIPGSSKHNFTPCQQAASTCPCQCRSKRDGTANHVALFKNSCCARGEWAINQYQMFWRRRKSNRCACD